MSEKRIVAVQKQVLKPKINEPTKYKNSSHNSEMLQNFQHLRNFEVLCDIKLETDDGSVVTGHKLIFISASQYFRAMFSCFEESKKDRVNIRELDSKVLEILVDYMYSGEIIITEENVQVLFGASDLLQIEFVKRVCAVFLQTKLDPSNCIGIKALADLYNCSKLVSISETFIKKQFLKVVKYDEFLHLSSEEVINFISSNDISVPFEEKVLECVIDWVKYKLDCRIDVLPKLMEHVRLPLLSKNYVLEKVVNEPLLMNNPKCKDYVFDALHFYLIKSKDPFSIPQTIRFTPRLCCSLQKIVLVLSWSFSAKKCITHWYDPATNKMQDAPEMSLHRDTAGICVVKNQFVFVLGGVNDSTARSVEMLDASLYSLYWASKFDMFVNRKHLGAGAIGNCVYAVGGYDDTSTSTRHYHHEYLNSVEVYDFDTRQWRMVASMSSKRSIFGVGVLDNLLYAVGGFNGSTNMKTVECYDPSLNKWKPVADMSLCRSGAGVGVLNGVMYAVGGRNVSVVYKSVETYRPSTGIWTPIPDMHLCRHNPGVVAFDGLLYVIGGVNGCSVLDSVEIYNPNTNTWSMKTLSIKKYPIYGAVVVDRPQYLRNNKYP